MGPGSGLYHLDAADGNHQTGDLGLLGVHGEVAEGGVCRLRAGVTLAAGESETSWKRAAAAALRRCWAFCCSTTFVLQRVSEDVKICFAMAVCGDNLETTWKVQRIFFGRGWVSEFMH